MTEIIRLESAAPVIFGVLELRCKDGFGDVVSLRSIPPKVDSFSFRERDPAQVEAASIDE